MTEDAARPPDLVDRIMGEWAAAYPDLDVSPIGILGRVQRIASVTSAQLDRNLEAHGIGRSEFDVLGALVRATRPLRASEVVSTTMLSGASVTKISDSLSRRGLLERRKSDRDGRVVLLVATDEGRRLVDEEIPRRLEDDRRVLSALSGAERGVLAELLRKISMTLGE
ncbi:MarR family transcriptional regulator [Gordonia sp. VNK1]